MSFVSYVLGLPPLPRPPPPAPPATPADLADPAAGWSPARLAYLTTWWPHFGERYLARWLRVPIVAIRAQVAACGLVRLPKAHRLCILCQTRRQSPHTGALWCWRCHRTRSRATAAWRAQTGRAAPATRDPLTRWIAGVLHTVQGRARRAGLPCDLTVADLVAQWHAQGGRCAYSDVPLRLPAPGPTWQPFAPSLDRVNPAQGYLPRNVVWATRVCNLGKSALSADRYEVLCSDVIVQALAHGGRLVLPVVPEGADGHDL